MGTWDYKNYDNGGQTHEPIFIYEVIRLESQRYAANCDVRNML